MEYLKIYFENKYNLIAMSSLILATTLRDWNTDFFNTMKFLQN